jgi:hypothetical protein
MTLASIFHETYAFVKLFKKDEAKHKTIWRWNNTKENDQIMVLKVHLWIIIIHGGWKMFFEYTQKLTNFLL